MIKKRMDCSMSCFLLTEFFSQSKVYLNGKIKRKMFSIPNLTNIILILYLITRYK